MRKLTFVLITTLLSTSGLCQKNLKLIGTWKSEYSLFLWVDGGIAQKHQDESFILDTLVFKPDGLITIYHKDKPTEDDNKFPYSVGKWNLLSSKMITITSRKTNSNVDLPDTQIRMIRVSKSKLVIEFMDAPEMPGNGGQKTKYQEVLRKIK